MNLTIANGRDKFYQWDLGQKLIVDDGGACNEVHFAGGDASCALVCRIREDAGLRVAEVPNQLLQHHGAIRAYLFWHDELGALTHYSKSFSVLRREKPESYVYTQQELINYSNLLDRLESIERDGVSEERITDTVLRYMEDHPITAESIGALAADQLPDAVKTALTDAKTSGMFDGKDGAAGPQGEKGDTGADGYTPARGIDYWTADDQAEIVEEVLEQVSTGGNVDFSGYVKTVNGISPDENGNVEIEVGGNVDCLPKYSEADNGKVLGIVDGNPAWIEATISGGGETPDIPVVPGFYGIVWDLVNVTSSNNAVQVSNGASLVAVLTAASGYSLGDVTITMGGEVLTGVWNADTATMAITSVTGDIVVSCAGVEKSTGGMVDTSAKIAQYDVGFHTDGKIYNEPGHCVTEPYDIPDGYVGKVTGLLASDGNPHEYNFQRLIYQDNTYKTYWSMKDFVKTAGSAPVTGGLYYASAWPANKVRFTLIAATLDDSYMYFTDTGDIIFAGKNTPHYGKANISDANTLSVAEMVDNEIAMLSLPTGIEVSTTAYEGLDEAYVSMVRDNYNAMMGEALGDYNKIPIIVHTDQHGRIGAGNPVMKLIGDLVNWYEVSKCINLGDTVSDRFNTTELEKYLAGTRHTIPLSKRLEVYGNHDILDADESQKYTVNQKRLSPYFKNIYARRHGNNGYFTVVDDYYNVKYLVINNWESKDTGDTTNKITPAQADFIISEMSADDGRDIILVSHIPFDSDDVISRDSTYIPYSEKFLTNTTAHNSFMAMLAARKNHTNGTFVDSSGEEHAYDFRNVSGKLLMSLHGHAHFEAYRKFENSVTEFIFDMFAGNTFYFGYIDRENMKFKFWKNETDVEAMEISIA